MLQMMRKAQSRRTKGRTRWDKTSLTYLLTADLYLFNWALKLDTPFFHKPFQKFSNYFINERSLRAVIEDIDLSNI